MLDNSFVNEEISWGTMVEEDVIESIEDFLEVQAPGAYACAMAFRDGVDFDDPEEVSYYCWETLFEIMDGIAPNGTYFGSHPGDGSCYGFWEDQYELEGGWD